ncbi:arylesterase [Caulobacter sp. KR2-114]|uniref:arylesterase n=1 Tax=Caulobacter sp. KR2-114 TaxID=3400912 RepID=UPI003BFBADDE
MGLALASPALVTAEPARRITPPGRRAKVVTILGDSITAGLGLPADQALPARLQAALAAIGAPAVVRGAGVSGDTMAAGLARVDFSVQADSDLCIVALGGNDLLQGLDPKATQASLERIVRRLKARRIGVLVAGMVAPPVIGHGYAHDYDWVFPAVARAERVPLYPNLLDGVGQIINLTQRDGIHPNAQGVQVIARRLAPVVARALKAHA